MAPEHRIDWQDLADRIREWGIELGFGAVGISDIDLSAYRDHLDSWLGLGYQGDMNYMSKHGRMRSEPATLHPGTQSLVSVRLDYLTDDPDPQAVLDDGQLAYVARYALGRDYHKTIRQRLKKLSGRIDEYLKTHGFEKYDGRVMTDSAPLLEKPVAEKAGLGWIGKHTLLLNEQAGSWFFLGEILTNLPLPATANPVRKRCGSCSACMDICPTDAIVAPFELDARRCISYLTIEHRGSIDPALRQPMGNRVFGCDDCQIACPWNRYAQMTREQDFQPRHGLEAPQLIELFNWCEETFLKNTEGSAIRRTGYDGWLRNLAIGLGNSPFSSDVISALRARKGISDLVDEHIDWALAEQADKAEK